MPATAAEQAAARMDLPCEDVGNRQAAVRTLRSNPRSRGVPTCPRTVPPGFEREPTAGGQPLRQASARWPVRTIATGSGASLMLSRIRATVAANTSGRPRPRKEVWELVRPASQRYRRRGCSGWPATIHSIPPKTLVKSRSRTQTCLVYVRICASSM